jgi:hypothetical protein
MQRAYVAAAANGALVGCAVTALLVRGEQPPDAWLPRPTQWRVRIEFRSGDGAAVAAMRARATLWVAEVSAGLLTAHEGPSPPRGALLEDLTLWRPERGAAAAAAAATKAKALSAAALSRWRELHGVFSILA